ncbi:DoxX family protein [Duganella qianjiadongensis]|uniref:DoxX family membrane protein n=1 Tax=Duganella qianjiadongensis TaxID=2692176 RepID=A0ABW9VLU4_9BURK|nr:DoxX family protein [Duganella qianjiadongensis]MYM40051.1 DoxX family membrane protein [Duganella qianjiadongensis]
MAGLWALHQRSLVLDHKLTQWGGAALGLFLRLYVGWQFFKAGMVKVADWGATLALFREEYHVPLLPPELAAYLGAAGELVLPVLLFGGLLSRPAALALLLVNAMAVLSYPQLFSFECPAAINDHFYWGVMLLALLVYGPGKISLDHGLAQRAR